MKKPFIFLLSLVITFISYARTSFVSTEKKELKLQGGGYESFSLLKENPQLQFKPEKEYYWFNNFSGVQSTKGGAGGQLLHGKLQQFLPNGMLVVEMNFSFGLKNGVSKEWDNEGTLISDSRYENDNLVYTKFINDEGYYIEWIGELFKKGSTKNVYGDDGRNLLQKHELFEDFKAIITNYYPYPVNIVESSFVAELSGDLKYGFYKVYYKNGQPKIEGNYENTNRVGIWKYYDEFGSLTLTESYRIYKEFYSNGKIKIEGGEFFNPDTKTWMKHGYWRNYNPEGDSDLKIYDLGTETNKIENY
jgi:antitoxin component YwqK of YwqJK toxin-antitoxin module